jgi:hypothetical protein
MRAGIRFRLNAKIFAIDLTKGERRTTIYIPEGEVVDVVARRDGIGHAEILWKSNLFLVSLADLEKLGAAVPK